MKKSKLIGLVSGIGCLAFAFGTVAQVNANAATTIGGVDVSSFRMEYGASVRFKPSDPTYKNGIRFKATLADEAYEALEALEGVNYGMLIVPADIAKNKPLTVENLFGENAVYCFEDPKFEGEEEGCTCEKQHIASVEYETLADVSSTDGVKNLRGSLVDILDSNLTREFIGLGYIAYNGEYVLAANAQDENGVEDVINNTRSMTYVAQLAIEDEQDDATGTLYTKYVKEFAEGSKEFAYTINHYLPDDNGEYGVPVVEKAYGKLNTEVSATHILKSTVDGAEGYGKYRLHEIETVKSNVKGTVYANGRTVLNAYYAPMNTSFQTVVNNSDYYLMGANTNNETKTKLEGATTAWHDTLTLGGETKEGVVQITTTAADNYTAGKFNMCFKGSEYKKAVENGYSYIKLHMYIVADESISELKMLSKNQSVAMAETGKWIDLIVPLAKLNQADTYLFGKNQTDFSKAAFEVYEAMGSLQYDSAIKSFLCTNTVKKGIGLTTTDITYYIDEVSWGIDTNAPEITVSGIPSEMNEGELAEPTVTVTDDMAYQKRLDATVVKTLYKVEGETRTEVAFTEGVATLTKGSYVYVVTADDRIYDDVVGNVATKEVAFEVTEVQDFVITFDSADDVRYVQKDESKVYETSISYLDAEALAAEGLNAGDVVPEGGAIKFVGGMENANAMYGAWVKLILSEEELEKVSVATAITFRMYVHPSSYPSWSGQEGFGKGEIDLYEGGNNKTSFIGFDRDTWVDVTISVADLSKEFSTYFNGTNNMFWTSTNTMYDKAGTITYYINSITFDITP